MSESGCECGTKENAVENSESTNAKAEDDESDEEIDTFVRGSVEVADSSVCVAEPASAITKSPNAEIVAETQDYEQENVQLSTRSENFSEEQASQTSEIDSCDSCESVKAEYDVKIQDMSNSLVLLNAKIVKKEDELAMWKKKFEDKCVETKTSTQKLQSELTARLEKALRMLEAVKNEKEAAVMKYVVVEQEIAAKEKAVDISERRRLHCEKEAVQANEKAKHMQIERTKFRQLVEDKENELIFARKEHDKLKCDNATLIQKLKGLEGRLQKETEAHAETQSKVAILNQKLREVKEEFDTIKKQSQELVKAYKSLDIEKNEPTVDDGIKSCASSESDISSLDDSTPSSHRSNLSIKDEQLPGTKFAGHFHAKDFEFLKRMQHCSVIEITSLRDQLSASKKDATAMQLCVREKTEELMVKEAEISTLKSRLDAYAVLETELESEKNRRIEVEEKRKKEQALVNECEERINEYQNREKSNLEYTTKLTNKITELQMELQDKGRDCEKLQKEIEALKDQISEAKVSTAADYDQQIMKEKENKQTELSKLSKIVEEKESRIAQLVLDFEEKENKWNIEKRKLDAVLKDTNRQLQSMKKLKESVESDLQVATETLKRGSENSSPWKNSSNGNKVDDGSRDVPAEDSNSDSNTWDLNHNNNNKSAKFANQGTRNVVKGQGTSMSIEKQSNVARSSVDKGHDMSSLVCASVEIAQPFKRGVVPKSSEGVNSFSEKWMDKYPGLDKNTVVEKLIKIQKQQKKLIEKSEVMEDQVFQLTEELKKKNKIIQYYVLREETGTLGSAAGNDTLLFNKIYSQKLASAQNSSVDHRRSLNPASKLTSLFSPSNGTTMHHTSSDGVGSGMSGEPNNLHFYKELNTRLQSVLEDTILKNMKLQENLDIMSSEVQSLKSAAVVATSSVTDFPLETPTSSLSSTSSNSSGTTRIPSTTTNGNTFTSHLNNNHSSSHFSPFNSALPVFEKIASSSANANIGDLIPTPLTLSRKGDKESEGRWSTVTADDLLRN